MGLLTGFAAVVYWRYVFFQQRFGPMGSAAMLFGSVGLSTAMAFMAFTSWGYLVMLAGLLANGTVVLANGGYMPTKGLRRKTLRHCPLTRRSQMPWLADVIWDFSIGDILLVVGALWSAQRNVP